MSNTPNAQQLIAINHVDGVMRVLAGPGTGKTEVLGQRIASLLKSDAQIAPQEILCITYTDAGKIAMRDRLTKIMGSDTAQKVNIHTYHSFCNEIIQSNKTFFRREDLEKVSDLEKLSLMHQLIDSLPASHIFKQTKNPYQIGSNLLSLFDNIKSENLQIENLLSGIDNYIENEMPLSKDFVYQKKYKDKIAGEFKPDYYTYVEKLQKSKQAIMLFDAYQKILRDAGRYDYNDMIAWVIQLLETNETVLQNYWEKYQYILVDEYQDTNGAQNKLIELLCSYSTDPNLFVVGDDDQTIFKFQGANAENMRMIEKRYGATLQDVKLNENYRSQQYILNTAEKLIAANTSRIKKDGNILESKIKAENIAPKLYRLDTARHEFAFIALQVQALINTKKVAPKEIAIIFRKNKQCLQMAKYLKHLDIPYFTESDQNLLEMPFIQQILNILEYVNAENLQYGSGNELLFKILHAPFFNVPAIHIGRANYNASLKREPFCTLREYLSTTFLEDANANETLKNVNSILEKLIADANSFPLYMLFRTLIEKCNLHAYILQQENSLMLLDQLTAMFSWLETETEAVGDLSIETLLSNIELMRSNKEKINVNSKLGTRNGVQILTIYKSKGLEYEYVFVPSCTALSWDKGRNNSGFTLPITITSSFASTHDDANSQADELRRLMYVAITRAKKEVALSFYAYTDSGKEEAMSQLVSQVFTNVEIEEAIETTLITTAHMALFEPIDLVSDKPLQIAQAKEDFIARQVAALEMNATALNNYLKCPLRFYFNNILRMPSGINENSNFGTAVHDALQYFFEAMKANNFIFGNLEELQTIFEKTMFRHRRNFTKAGFQQKLDYGKIILEKNYNENINTWVKKVELEWKPKAKVVFNEIPLTAKVDKLEFNTPQNVSIVDYKTGDVDSFHAKENVASPSEKHPNGGDYWRQAVFYKIFMNISEPTWQFNSAKFVYVEPSKKDNKLHVKPIVIADEAEQIVKKQIEETWKNIHAHNFYTGCNDAKCAHCNFVKENNLEVK